MMRQIRRVVTGLNQDGKSTILKDGPVPSQFELPDAGLGGHLVWLTDQTPASNEGNEDAADRPFPALPEEVAPRHGTCFYVFEYPPLSKVSQEQREALLKGGIDPSTHERPGMHVTATTDYIVMISGEMTFIVEDGEVTLRPGDTLIDRGIYHAWENRGTDPAVFASITIDAKPMPQMASDA